MNFLPFSMPEISDDEVNEVSESLRTGWVTTGPKTKQFETDFSGFLDGDLDSIAVNSATAALHLGLEALGIGPGDQVITTTHTFTATAEIIRYLGAHPVFVDINEETLCIDVDAIERAVTPRTKAVIPVHFGGLAADMNGVHAVAKKHNLYVVEDAAHAFPATFNGRLIGTLDSDVTVYSFYANKTMTTGEGGMLVTRNPEIAKRVRIMRLHGIDRDAFDRFTGKKPSWHYEVVAPGFKYNMTDIAAAIGVQQLLKVSDFQKRREQIADQYNSALADLPLILPPLPNTGDIHSWHLYVTQLESEAPVNRDRFVELMYEHGVGCSVHYIPLHLHPYWRDTYSLVPGMFPVSQKVYERSVSVPIYSKMSDNDVDRVITTIRKLLG